MSTEGTYYDLCIRTARAFSEQLEDAIAANPSFAREMLAIVLKDADPDTCAEALLQLSPLGVLESCATRDYLALVGTVAGTLGPDHVQAFYDLFIKASKIA